jgi:malate dehydrogenase
VDTVYPLGDLSDYEKEGLAALVPELTASIEKGVKFVKEAAP